MTTRPQGCSQRCTSAKNAKLLQTSILHTDSATSDEPSLYCWSKLDYYDIDTRCTVEGFWITVHRYLTSVMSLLLRLSSVTQMDPDY